MPDDLGDLAAMTPFTTSRPHVLAPSRRNDKLARQTATILGALDSGHVIAAIVSAIPGSVYMLTENFIDDEIRCLRRLTPYQRDHTDTRCTIGYSDRDVIQTRVSQTNPRVR